VQFLTVVFIVTDKFNVNCQARIVEISQQHDHTHAKFSEYC